MKRMILPRPGRRERRSFVVLADVVSKQIRVDVRLEERE